MDWYHRWDWSSLSDWFISVFLKWFILTAGFTFLAALPPWFCSSLPLFPALYSSSLCRSPALHSSSASFLFPSHVGRTTSSCSHLEGLCLCCEQNSFLTERGPDSPLVHSSCSGSPSESWGRQPCASGAAHMPLWRGKEQAVNNQDYTAIK